MATTLAWKVAGRLWVAVHSAENPSGLDWARFVNDSRANPPGPNGRVLVISFGGGPDNRQRRELAETVKRAVPTAILTSSLFLRGLGHAFAFFNPQMKIVGLHEAEKAYDFLELTPEERRQARRLQEELTEQLTRAGAQIPTGGA